MQRDYGPLAGQWHWTASRLKPADADGLRRYANAHNYCDTKEEAQKAAEAFYYSARGDFKSGG